MKIESKVQIAVIKAVKQLYKANIDIDKIQIQKTRREFKGDYTVLIFSLIAFSKKLPEITANEIGDFIQDAIPEISSYNVVKGFLNLSFTDEFWLTFFNKVYHDNTYAFNPVTDESEHIVIEYSSPNTNKPLHLGHVRNNLLGSSVAEILKANGNKVFKVNLVNDRGIHICKSMLAWQELANGETPKDAKMKGDHFVGKYYVLFDKEYKKQVEELVVQGMDEKEAKAQAPWMKKAQGMLKRWERGNKKIRELWNTMNDWVYEGFDETYKKLGVEFDKVYHESDTYIIGKEIVMKALRSGELVQKPDGTVVLELKEYDMDEKVLLRSDGTTVYMTQDLGTAVTRYEDYHFDESIYVVGNEQDYHFKVLSIILDKLEYPWSNRLTHLSYGMVNLPEGKMKSREGTVVDADDLIEEMLNTSRETAEQLGKLEGFTKSEKEEIHRVIALGALKYFILKIDARKNITFNPKESIDFAGNTGPFIQYTYVRINSLLRKANAENIFIPDKILPIQFNNNELELLRLLYQFREIIREAGDKRNPGIIANYVYELAKEYNKFYHEFTILKEMNDNVRSFRLALSDKSAKVIKSALGLLNIEVPSRM